MKGNSATQHGGRQGGFLGYEKCAPPRIPMPSTKDPRSSSIAQHEVASPPGQSVHLWLAPLHDLSALPSMVARMVRARQGLLQAREPSNTQVDTHQDPTPFPLALSPPRQPNSRSHKGTFFVRLEAKGFRRAFGALVASPSTCADPTPPRGDLHEIWKRNGSPAASASRWPVLRVRSHADRHGSPSGDVGLSGLISKGSSPRGNPPQSRGEESRERGGGGRGRSAPSGSAKRGMNAFGATGRGCARDRP